MNTERLGRSKIINLIFGPAGAVMESGLRHRLSDPERILRGAELEPGQAVLEVGSGTEFFTLPAARAVGEGGSLVAMEPLATYVERLNEKVGAAGLGNVQVIQRDALKTELEDACMDRVLLFGVLPYPSLPLKRLLPEMHRVLKPEGTLAVWMFPIAGWVPRVIGRSAFFAFRHKRYGVHSYSKRVAER